MKAIYFSNEIDYDPVKGLLSDIDKVDKDENIVLYFVSSGGNVPDADIIIDYINRQPKRFELVCFWEMGSAAFSILWKVNCKITIDKNAFALLHLSTNSLESRELLDKYSESMFKKNNVDRNNKEWIEDLKYCKLTKDEYKCIMDGGTLFINSDRVKIIVDILRQRHNLIRVI